MQREFLQEKSLNRSQGNAEKSLNVDLSAKSRIIPHSASADMLGLYNLYTEERDACENYRMIFTVNPVCTNVLYNAITEPVFKEGSYSAVCLTLSPVSSNNTDIFPEGVLNQSAQTVDEVFAVRDTEFSHERIGNFVYHCGYDIFNNHLLRSKEFEHVKMEGSQEKLNKNVFNTVFDYAIDYSGKPVERVIDEYNGAITSTTLNREKLRMYQLDNLKTMHEAFYDGLRTVDGWYGFYNVGYINIPNAKLGNKDISINQVINNENPCEFIDFYPDRTLYSFIPKVNRDKKRLERNWDCSIVYPYKSDYDFFGKVNKNRAGAVRVLDVEVYYDNVGNERLLLHSALRHTLEAGDTIRLYYRGQSSEEAFNIADWDNYTGDEMTRYSVPVRVVSTGDHKGEDTEHYFTIKLYDVETFCDVHEDENGEKELWIKDGGELTEKIYFFYTKITDGCDCRYYFRKFKKLQSYEYVQTDPNNLTEEERSNAVRAIKEPTTITDGSPKVIILGNDYFLRTDRPLTYTQNKIAFAGNIYGDRVAQVIFNDDICTSGLKDNLGRPLTTVYFMVAKTNRGNSDWYGPNSITTADTVEFSHCFGQLTSGLDLPERKESTEYNVRKLHNMFRRVVYMDSFGNTCDSAYETGLETILEDVPTGAYSGTPLPIETNITIDDFNEFYGDIIEFSRVQFKETVIEKVYHRFNTAQRECLNKKFYDVHYDDLIGDLYDVDQIEN